MQRFQEFVGCSIAGQPLAKPVDGGLRGGHISSLAKLCWGLFYGLGVGAGLGYALFTFQDEPAESAKTLNSNDTPSTP